MDKSSDEIIGESQPVVLSSEHGGRGSGPSNRGGVSKRRSRRGGPSSGRSGSQPKPQKTVAIQNSQDNISEDDSRDSFRQVGPVVRVEIQRDGAGNRTGNAWVVYDFAQDALVAAERYNKRKAAGKIISVRRVSRVGESTTQVASLGDRIGAQPAQSARAGRRRGAKKKTSAERSKKAAPQDRSRSVTDSDAELDAYMQVDSVIPESGNTPAPAAAPAPEAAQEKPEETMIEV